MPLIKYVHQGVRKPSVTTILGQYKSPDGLMGWVAKTNTKAALESIEDHFAAYDTINKAEVQDLILDADQAWRRGRKTAAEKGKLAHDLVEKELHGLDLPFDWAENHEEEEVEQAREALANFRRWKDAVRFEFIASEVSLVSGRYGGTFDVLANVNKLRTLIDLKATNRVYVENLRQLGGYANLLEHGEINENQATARMPSPRALGLGERIQQVVIIQLDKGEEGKERFGWADFRLGRPGLEKAMESFLHLVDCYEADKELKKEAGL